MTEATATDTPTEQREGIWVKRDDAYAYAGVRGGKVRTCLALATARPDTAGLITAGAAHSPQVAIVARIAHALGLPARCHVPARNDYTPEMEDAHAHGATLVEHRPGRNSVIVARAREDAARRPKWAHIPFGMECSEAIRQTRHQVPEPIPGVRRIVTAVGSGMSLAGILYGLEDRGWRVPVAGIVVGADPTKRLDTWAPRNWWWRAHLEPAGWRYDEQAPTEWEGITLDHHYEAKATPHLRPGDLFWIVGIRPSQTPEAL